MNESVAPYSFGRDQDDFWRDLQSRIRKYLKTQRSGPHANYKYYTKAMVMASLQWVPFFVILLLTPNLGLFYLLWVIAGIGMAGIGMNVMHDAIHRSVSNKKWVNQLLGASIYLLCGNAFNWRVQHNMLHHGFTNIPGIDEDIDAGGLIRLHHQTPWKKAHRYQHIYAPLLYGFLTINWVLFKEFNQLFTYHKKGLTQQVGKGLKKEIAILIATKLLYFAVFLALPMLVTPYAWYHILLGFLVMHFVAGFILSFIFQLAHVVEEAQPPIEDDASSWAVHQMENTANFSTRNKLITYYSGGLNFQVEHHLFPSICHVHYPQISKIVKQTAQEYNKVYLECPKFWEAVNLHLKHLKTLGEKP